MDDLKSALIEYERNECRNFKSAYKKQICIEKKIVKTLSW